MATVWIPSPMQSFTAGRQTVHAEGANVRQLLDALEAQYPGLKQAVVLDGELRPDVAIAVDGQIAPLGLRQPVNSNNEVYIVPAISGG